MLDEATESAGFCPFICPQVLVLGALLLSAEADCLLREIAVEETEELPIDDTRSDSLVALLLGVTLRRRGWGVEAKYSLEGKLMCERGVPPRWRLAFPPLVQELSETLLAPLFNSGASSLAGTLRWRMRGVDAKWSLRPRALEISETWLGLLCETAP